MVASDSEAGVVEAGGTLVINFCVLLTVHFSNI